MSDDGVGFSPDGGELVRQGHFGIAGMRQRVEMVGGTLEIESSPGSGTTVRARVPKAAPWSVGARLPAGHTRRADRHRDFRPAPAGGGR